MHVHLNLGLLVTQFKLLKNAVASKILKQNKM